MAEVADDWGLPTEAGERRRAATLDRVRPLLAAVRAASDRQGRLSAWAGVLPHTQALAELWAADEDSTAALLAEVEALPGMGDPVAVLRSRLRRITEGWHKDMRRKLGAPEAPRGMGEAPRPPQLPAACQVPEPYVIHAGGVGRTVITEEEIRVVPVCAGPLYLVGRAVDLDTGEHWCDVAWPDEANGWVVQQAPRSTLSDARGVVELSGKGAPVHSGCAREVVPYLAALEADWRAHLPAVPVLTRCGWTERGAMVGPRWFGPGRVSLRAPGGYEAVLEAVAPRGTLSGWLRAWSVASSRPIPVLAVYASVASMLLTPMGAPGCTLDLWGRTTGGKTTTLRLAASVWGSPAPGGMVRQWSVTPTWRERYAEALGSLPLLMDDTRQMSARDRESAPQTVYNHAFGLGKGRGNVTGAQRQATWRSWLISTGESPLLTGGGNDGARARCLSLEGSPFGTRSQAEAVGLPIDDHYGHVGAAVAAWAVAHRAELAERYEQRREAWAVASAAYGAIAQRLSSAVATLDVAATVLEEVGIPAPECDPWAAVMEALRQADQSADQPLAAWRAVYARATARGLSWWGRGDEERDPVGGWLGAWDAPAGMSAEPPPAILPQVVRGWLAEDGHDPDATLAEWRRRGWIEVDADGRMTGRRTVGHGRVRCVVMTAAAMEAL